ncbi:MAG: hypothetical protein IJP34_05695 [Clostridia bacterium]|nr:hypothetical protein [Clostridia bacterium]
MEEIMESMMGSGMTESMVAMGVFALVIAIYGGIFLIAGISYLLESIAFFKIGQRRLIPNSWLSFIPIANYWVVGKIVEDYDLKQQNIKRNWAKTLLILVIAGPALAIVSYIALLLTAMGMGIFADTLVDESAIIGILPIFILFYIVFLVAVVIMSAFSILTAICVFKIFESLKPEKAIKYILLFMIVPLAGPILLFKNRNEGYDYLPIEEDETEEAPLFEETEDL